MTGVQQGDINRKWKGWWKIHPDQHEGIALDPRPSQELAILWKVSPSYIARIKRDYKIKHNLL